MQNPNARNLYAEPTQPRKFSEHELRARATQVSPTMGEQTRRDEQSKVGKFQDRTLTSWDKKIILDVLSIKPLGTRSGVKALLFEETKMEYDIPALEEWFQREKDNLIEETPVANPERYNGKHGIPKQESVHRKRGDKIELDFDTSRHWGGDFCSADRRQEIHNRPGTSG
jgi:hypothetical protein